MIYLRLFIEFFKTGLFAVGGGMATVPFLIDISKRTGWFTLSQLTDMIAVSESTPGPIGVNMATYVGYSTAGITGGVIATLGLIMPSIIIITVIAALLSKFSERQIVKTVFRYLKAAAIGLLTYAVYCIAGLSFSGPACFVFYAVSLVCIFLFKKIHPMVFILSGALFGIISL